MGRASPVAHMHVENNQAAEKEMSREADKETEVDWCDIRKPRGVSGAERSACLLLLLLHNCITVGIAH